MSRHPALVIAGKDLRLESRSRDVVTSAGLFALVIVVTASFSLPASGAGRATAAAGALWMAVLFAGLLGVGRSQAWESEHRCLEAMLLAPIGRESVFLGKLLANLAFLAAVELLLVPAFLVLTQTASVAAPAVGLLALSVALGTVAVVTLGTLFGVIAAATRMQQALLPVLALPVLVPVMIAAVQSSAAALSGAGLPANLHWLALMTGYDAALLAVAVLTFGFLVEE